MSLIDGVWSFANEFMNSKSLVSINSERINEVAKAIDNQRNEYIDHIDQNKHPSLYLPKCIKPTDPYWIEKVFFYELIANSVNYCYWYGRHDIRPNGASSAKMYSLLDESFDELAELKKSSVFHPHHGLEIIIGHFINKLSRARFPLIDHRVAHLKEILNRSDLLSVIEMTVLKEDYSIDKWLDYIVTSFPGYAKDLFLKRAFLFIMSMYRRCGIFGKEIHKVLVPADYQVPKVLRWLGCIEYDSSLAFTVDNELQMAENCSVECEIRAATIIACKQIADLANCSCEEVDTYLWSKRNECSDPFHLVVTSNY